MAGRKGFYEIVCSIIIAVGLMTAGGYFAGGWTEALSRGTIASTVLGVLVTGYFMADRFVSNHLETYLTILVMMIKRPGNEISQSPKELREEAKKISEAITDLKREIAASKKND